MILLDNFNRSIGSVVSVVAFVGSIYVAMNTPNLPGTEFFFLLPLMYGIVALFCKDVFAYHERAYGLKCFYVVSFVRYVVLPVYTCYVGEFGSYDGHNNPEGYLYAIFVSVLEIIVSYLTIRKFYLRIYAKENAKKTKKIQFYNDLSIGGCFLLLFVVTIVVMRGHLNDVIGGIRFLVVNSKFDMDADFWTYEIWAIQVLFAFITIVVTSFFQKRENRKSSWINIICPTLCAFFSCSLILTNNRMTIVYYALCGLCILQTAFPKRTKVLSSLMIGALMVVMVTFTAMKNFSIDATNMGGNSISHNAGASMLSEYVCGIENIAHSYDMYQINGDKFSFNNVIAEIVRFAMPMRLPGLKSNSYSRTPTTVDLATQGTEMVSVAGETLFWGSLILGWLLDIIAVFIIVRFLVYFDIKTKLEDDLGKKYVYSWLSILYGIFMCYCIQTLWNNTTFIPLFLTVVLWVNRVIRIHKTAIIK